MSDLEPANSKTLLERLGLPNPLSRVAFAITSLLLIAAVWNMEAAAALLEATKQGVVGYFDWLFVGVGPWGGGANGGPSERQGTARPGRFQA